jgi:hypothetical protein
MNNNPLPLPSLPTQETIDSIISYAPQPVRPIARKTFAWLKQKLTPFDVPEPGEHSTSVTGADPTDYGENSSPGIDSDIEGSKKNVDEYMDIKAKPEKGQMSVMVVLDSPNTKPESNREPEISRAFVPSAPESRTPSLLISKRTPPSNTRAPTPLSSMKMSAPILAGSEFVLPNKIRIHPEEQARVAAELKEAIEDNEFFFKRWPTYEDSRITHPPVASSQKMYDGPPAMICLPKTPQPKATPTPKTPSTQKNDKKYVNKGKQNQQQQGEASALYTRKLAASETSRRERIKKQWADKEERDISKRGRVEGGLEDTVENAMLADLSMFTPTLYRVQFQPSEVVLGWSDRVVRPGDQRGVNAMAESVRGLAIEGENSDGDSDDEDEVFEHAESGIEEGEERRDSGRGVVSSRQKQEGKRKHCYRKDKSKQKQTERTQQSSDSEASLRRLPRIRRRSKPMEDVQRATEESEQPISREKEQSSDSNLTRSGIQQQRPTPRQKRESEEDTDNRLAYGLEEL